MPIKCLPAEAYQNILSSFRIRVVLIRHGREIMQTKPESVIKMAVEDATEDELGKQMLSKLKIYAGINIHIVAQQPVKMIIK